MTLGVLRACRLQAEIYRRGIEPETVDSMDVLGVNLSPNISCPAARRFGHYLTKSKHPHYRNRIPPQALDTLRSMCGLHNSKADFFPLL